MSDTHTLTPTFIIYLNGARIPIEMEAAVMEVIVDERLNDSSTFTIALSDPDCKWRSNKDLDFGGKIKIMMGYKDNVKTLMIGEITGQDVHFEQGFEPTVKIQGSDVIHRLEREFTTRGYNDVTVGDIVKKMCSKKKIRCVVGELGDEVKPFRFQRNCTDMEYMLYMASWHNCMVYTRDEKLYFMPMKKTSTLEPVILEYQKTLTEFVPYIEARGRITEVRVTGWNRDKWESMTAVKKIDDIDFKVGGSYPGAKIGAETYGPGIHEIHDVGVKSLREAEKRAVDEITNLSMDYITGTGICEGDPNIRIGEIIEIKGIAPHLCGGYYTKRVKHVLSMLDGYTTKFWVKRNCIPKKPNQGSSGNIKPAPKKKEEKGTLYPCFENLKWKLDGKTIEKAHVGDKVQLTCDCSHMEKRQTVSIKIYEKDTTTPDDFIEEIRGKVIGGGKVEGNWTFLYTEDTDDANSEEEQKEKGYTKPEYYFIIETLDGKHKSEKSGICEMYDRVEIKLKKGNGTSVKNLKYIVFIDDGHSIEGTLDENGYAKIENLYMNNYFVVFPDLGNKE
jgi:uncharacterized protein